MGGEEGARLGARPVTGGINARARRMPAGVRPTAARLPTASGRRQEGNLRSAAWDAEVRYLPPPPPQTRRRRLPRRIGTSQTRRRSDGAGQHRPQIARSHRGLVSDLAKVSWAGCLSVASR
ncbi:unnamed protein product [Urochloa humidicola]